MNILLWILQGLLALHTVTGALWKFSNSEQAVPTLKAIPHGAWMAMSVVEILCAVALVLPAFKKPATVAVPTAATIIAVEMLLFCIVHFSSGARYDGQVTYWLVVAALCAFIAYGRFVLKPL